MLELKNSALPSSLSKLCLYATWFHCAIWVIVYHDFSQIYLMMSIVYHDSSQIYIVISVVYHDSSQIYLMMSMPQKHLLVIFSISDKVGKHTNIYIITIIPRIFRLSLTSIGVLGFVDLLFSSFACDGTTAFWISRLEIGCFSFLTFQAIRLDLIMDLFFISSFLRQVFSDIHFSLTQKHMARTQLKCW